MGLVSCVPGTVEYTFPSAVTGLVDTGVSVSYSVSKAALSCELIRLTGVLGKGAGGGASGNLKPCNFENFGKFLKLKI